jgi:hypothetical protein
MDLNHNLILGCSLCDIFSNLDKYELFYPKTKDLIIKHDFIIIKCKECDKYILILRDHTESITNEMFGRILYTVKKLFNNQINMNTSTNHHSKDHFHCHIDVK